MSLPVDYDVIAWDGHSMGARDADYYALFTAGDGSWAVAASTRFTERRNTTPDLDSGSLNAWTLPPLHIVPHNGATVDRDTFRRNVRTWFSRAGNRSGLRYLHMYLHDGDYPRRVRIGCVVTSIEMVGGNATHFIVSLTAPGVFEDAEAATATNPTRLSNLGTEPTHPIVTLTTDTHKTLIPCTVTGINAVSYPVRFPINDSAAGSTNVYTLVSGLSRENKVINPGTGSAAVWTLVDIASDATTDVAIVYGSGLVNDLCGGLDDGGIDFAASTNGTIQWDDLRVTDKPGRPLSWQLGRTGSTGGVSNGSYQLTSEAAGSITFTRYTDSSAQPSDADSMVVIAPGGIATLSGVDRTTVNHAAPSAAVATVTPGGGGANEVQRVTLLHASGGSFPLEFNGRTTDQIAHNATTGMVKDALEALSTIGAGQVSVTGGPLPDTPLLVEFIGTLANTNVVAMTTDSAALLGDGARSYARGWVAGYAKPVNPWATQGDATVSGASLITFGAGAQRVALGIEYITATPQTEASLTLERSLGQWTATIDTPPTVMAGSAVNLDYYDGTLQVGDAEAIAFDGFMVQDGDLVIDCAAHTLTYGTAVPPLGLFDPDPDVWLALEPGNQTVTNTAAGTAVWQYRSGWF